MSGPSNHVLPLDRLLAGQKRALELAVAGAPLGDVLAALALALEEVFDGRLLVSILLLDRDGRHLRHGAAPSLPAAYNQAIDGIAIGAASGSCGTAAFSRRRVIVEDIASDPVWRDYRELAIQHGLRACWSTPILSSTGAVLGTFAIYARDTRRPAAAENDTVDLLAHTAALVVERERSQEALVTSHERYRLVAEAANDAIWDWDIADDEITWSPGLRKHYGHVPSTAQGDPGWWISHIHPDDVTRVHFGFRHALEHDEFWEEEYRFARADGAYAVVLDRGRIVRGPDGRPTRVVGAMINVTERRRAQARDRFLVLLDDALRPLGDPTDITRTAATVLGEYLRVNRCAYAEVQDDEDTFLLTGNYTNGVDSIVGRYTFTAFGADCLQHMRRGEPYVVADSQADPRIDDAARKAFEAMAIRAVVCVPVSKEGRLAAALAVHHVEPRTWRTHEIALVQQVASRCWESIERARLTRTLQEAVEREQRAREDAETQRRRAESANRAKDEFLAMLGHELRNPLSPIRTALQLMKLRGSDLVQRERTVIERQVGHLTRLVDDLLDVSRIARGKVDLRVERVAVADIVARAIEVASPLLEERGHHLAVDLPPEPLTLMGDPTRLGQVLSNLLTNAAKYTDRAGDITVRASREGDEVVMSVADTGRGISPETLPHVFDLFVQERQGRDRAEGGLGLGLAIVRSLVERHGGRIEAHSSGLGRGSVFTVRLPAHNVATAATPARQEDVPASAAEHRKRVLVVDDNEDGAAMLAAVLDARGHLVQVAHDGPTALELARVFLPEIALLDIGLPVMDGYELAVKLREVPELAQVTLVAVTGYGQSTDKARSRAAGFNHHLVKPVDLQAVEEVLR